jgi:hypothetical protein
LVRTAHQKTFSKAGDLKQAGRLTRRVLPLNQVSSLLGSVNHSMRTLCGRGTTERYCTASLCFLSHLIFLSLSLAFMALFGILDNGFHLPWTFLRSTKFITMKKGGWREEARLNSGLMRMLTRRTSLRTPEFPSRTLGFPLSAP